MIIFIFFMHKTLNLMTSNAFFKQNKSKKAAMLHFFPSFKIAILDGSTYAFRK